MRQPIHLPVLAQRDLAVSADGADPVDTIADLHSGDVGADGVNGAADVGARCVRQVRFARVRACPDVGVHRVDAGGVHSNRHLLRTGHRLGHVLELHHIR